MDLSPMLDDYYEQMNDDPRLNAYHERHGTQTALILTVFDDDKAAAIAEVLRPRIEGRVVVEIGAGIGLLACHLAGIAKRVIAIEVDPAWASCFVLSLYEKKPPNLTFVFGRAEEVVDDFRADVAIFCTHSGHNRLRELAGMFAPEVIDVYEEILQPTGTQ